MNQNIKKVKLLKVKGGHGLTLTFDMTDDYGALGNGGIDYKGLIHNDLKTAMQGLAIHYGVLLGLIKVEQIEDIAMPDLRLIEKITISGYSLGGEDGEGTEGIVLTGHYIGPRRKAIIVNTPFELFDCAPEARYIYMDDFIAKLRTVQSELSQYNTGKRGEPVKDQEEAPKGPVTGNLFEQKEEPITKAQIAVPIGDGSGQTVKIPPADKEAMKRLKEEEAPPPKPKAVRKVKQSSDHPSGQAEEEAGD